VSGLEVEVLTPEAAAERVRPGAVVTVSGVVGSLVPETVLRALRRRFDASGEPGGLTVIFPVAVGDVFEAPGLDHLADPAILSTIVGGSFVYGRRADTGEEPTLTRLILDGGIEAYNFSIGTLFCALREQAAGRPGLITRTGVGTFQDPRERGGRLNDRTPPRFVSVVELDGTDYLRYQLPAPKVALLRGTTADEQGNISMERELIDGGVLVQALAARNSGGQVIVQVERLAQAGSLAPRQVVVPGALVDAVVVAPGGQQATGTRDDPYLSGELRAPAMTTAPELDPVERIILPRVVARLRERDLVILGFGIPSLLPTLPELPGHVRFTVEHGAIGGTPAGGLVFGGAVNAEALIDTPSMFDLINGGGCDVACLGFAEVAFDGSVNVSRLPKALPGSGGFTDITAATRRLIFCGSFTAGGLEVEEQDGRIRITREGRFKKLVRSPRELTFKAGGIKDQEVVFVTDRCILERQGDGLVVTELYPGVDLRRDVLDQTEFALQVAPGLGI
jgi:propionate CoA-transferase